MVQRGKFYFWWSERRRRRKRKRKKVERVPYFVELLRLINNKVVWRTLTWIVGCGNGNKLFIKMEKGDNPLNFIEFG